MKTTMERSLVILILLLTPTLSIAQNKTFFVKNHKFETKTEIIKNQWGTKDTLQTLNRIEVNNPKYVLKFYKYKNEGGDCNNLFWNRERMEVIGDSIIFTTHYYQKTGIDPIPEWRKQIYEVNLDGQLILK